MNPSTSFSSSWSVPAPFLSQNEEKNMAVVFSQLLPNILNYLPDSKLIRNCRLVSRLWRDEATSILRRRKTAKCIFDFCSQRQKFIHTNKRGVEESLRDGNGKTLGELSQLLSCPFQTFPSSWFFLRSGSLNHPEAVEFFSSHGGKFKRLTVDIVQNQVTPAGFLITRFFGLVPNLEILGFIRRSWSNFPTGIQAPPHQLQLEENEIPNQNQIQRPLLPSLRLLTFDPEIKLGGPELAQLSAILNLLRSDSIAPQLSSLDIQRLNLAIKHEPNWRQNPNPNPNQNGGISILKTLTSTLNVKFNSMDLPLFYPKDCPLEIIEAVAEMNLQTESLTLSNCGHERLLLTSLNSRRPSKAHFLRARTALWRIMENSSQILENVACSFQVFNLLFRIPFPPGRFQKLREIYVNFADYEQAFKWSAHDYFRCPSAASSTHLSASASAENDVPRRHLWADLSSVAPCLKTFFIVLPSLFFELEEWLPFLNPSPNPNPNELENPILTSTSTEGATSQHSTRPPLNSSVENLIIANSSPNTPLTPQILGLFIKCFPNLKEVDISIHDAQTFRPLLDQNQPFLTLEQIVCFIFGIDPENPGRANPVKVEMKMTAKEKYEHGLKMFFKSAAEPFSELFEMATASVRRRHCSLGIGYGTGIGEGFGPREDLTASRIRTLLNLKRKGRKAFSANCVNCGCPFPCAVPLTATGILLGRATVFYTEFQIGVAMEFPTTEFSP